MCAISSGDNPRRIELGTFVLMLNARTGGASIVISAVASSNRLILDISKPVHVQEGKRS